MSKEIIQWIHNRTTIASLYKQLTSRYKKVYDPKEGTSRWSRRIPLFLSRTRNRKRAREAGEYIHKYTCSLYVRAAVTHVHTHVLGPDLRRRVFIHARCHSWMVRETVGGRPWLERAHSPRLSASLWSASFSMNEFTLSTSLLPPPVRFSTLVVIARYTFISTTRSASLVFFFLPLATRSARMCCVRV